eukprot:TRINITY_DN9671_c0_g1_i1.p1 TRINITY_DN9671_c0_g1~~TRINITY_DN9671_c0_g1_i1.p1  ORF type:complete len:404 (+),score=85.09 TRINITY_DN9671_c0_g1_i1:320-1531(+)
MIVASETCGTVRQDYQLSNDETIQYVGKKQSRFSPKQIIYEAFLPSGYPESVSSDYMWYQIWDSVQASASSISGVLSARAVLSALGVGDDNATPTAAVLSWIWREGAGMFGRVIFGWYQGTNLDSNAKTWRLAADVLNDIAMFIELLAPFFPQYVLVMLCLSSILKSLVGVAGGATRTSLTQHQARRDNISDVAVKDSSQEMAVGIFGMLLGMYIIPLIDSEFKTWLAFIVFTAIHLFSNYMAVIGIIMEKINPQRANIILTTYLEYGNVPSPEQVAKEEKIFQFRSGLRYKIAFGSPLSSVLEDINYSAGKFESLLENGGDYFIHTNETCIFVVLHKNISAEGLLKAYIHGLLYCHNTKYSDNNEFEKFFVRFNRDISLAGWKTSGEILGASEWRSTWNIKR